MSDKRKQHLEKRLEIKKKKKKNKYEAGKVTFYFSQVIFFFHSILVLVVSNTSTVRFNRRGTRRRVVAELRTQVPLTTIRPHEHRVQVYHRAIFALRSTVCEYSDTYLSQSYYARVQSNVRLRIILLYYFE
jgi:hypothetical protein